MNSDKRTQQSTQRHKRFNEIIARSRRLILLPILFLYPPTVVASELELTWDGVPLEIQLEVGEERLVHFPYAVDVGVSNKLAEMVRVQSIENTIYFTAGQEFSSQRILVRSREDNAIVILEVAAQAEPVGTKQVCISIADNTQQPHEPTLSYGDLVRFAAQHFYAPKRLQTKHEQITPVKAPSAVRSLIRHEAIKVGTVKSWKTEQGIYITGVVIKNTSNTAIELDPFMLRGNWLAASFQHYRLLPKKTEANITVVYLISETDFATALDQ